MGLSSAGATAVSRMIERLLRHRRGAVVALQLSLVAAANFGAFWLRFDGEIPQWAIETCWATLPWLLLIRGAWFVPFRLYEGLWRYTSVWDLRNLVLGVTTSSVVFYTLSRYVLGSRTYPRSVYLIDALLLMFLLGGLRLASRAYRELVQGHTGRRVLVYGAGDAGEMIVRDMRRNRAYGYEPIGFVDDDASKRGSRIHGVQVLGTRSELPRILRERRPEELLIAIPSAPPEVMREIVHALGPHKIPIKVVPRLRDIIDGRVELRQLRALAIEDLLTRRPVDLDVGPVRALIEGRRVMVTGAGGSIGAELCRQIARLRPARLVLYERYENGLHAVSTALRDEGLDAGTVALVGDVTDAGRLERVMDEHGPELVFHAAAHKHVPLMEENACEAVKNNVTGTRLVAEAAERHEVDRFVLISTDKAVNPTSVMGATKRVAELLIQALAPDSGTSFLTVRFGNVLGSSGSVVPRFLEQIKAGGPVTVTHPEMRRYFMLIPEAVELVLHAAAAGSAGEVYVLQMGEQIRVLDMARNLIRLAGFVPEEEIPITFTGPRPGEKLYEELVGPDEKVAPSAVPEVLRVQGDARLDRDVLMEQIAELERLARAEDTAGVLEQLRVIVPEFRPALVAAEAARVEAPGGATEVGRRVRDLPPLRCPVCASGNIHRSRARTWKERMKKRWAHERPYRCHDCGWRDWVVPPAPPGPDGAIAAPTVAQVDLGSIDAAAVSGGRQGRRRFSPRDLS